MCGFAGFVRDAGPTDLTSVVSVMADTLRHRGPDDGGTWVAVDAGVAFGFRRLSIVELSPAGHQPMQSACGRYVLVFNGEIYNHLALRADSRAPVWPRPGAAVRIPRRFLRGLQPGASPLP